MFSVELIGINKALLCVSPGSELDSELGCGTYPNGTDDGP